MAAAYLQNEGGGPNEWAPKLAGWAGMPLTASAAGANEACTEVGKRLPTVEEYMWAYWGGDEDRPYPWGSGRDPLETSRQLSTSTAYSVHALPNSTGRWGHLGLATNVDEFATLRPFEPKLFKAPPPGWIPTTVCARLEYDGVFESDTHRFPCGAHEKRRAKQVLHPDDEDDLSLAYGAYFNHATSGFRCAVTPRTIAAPGRNAW